jgi:hypothetical protein
LNLCRQCAEMRHAGGYSPCMFNFPMHTSPTR